MQDMTNTQVDKKLASPALLHALSERGLRAPGTVMHDPTWHKDDAGNLADASSIAFPTSLLNPYQLGEVAVSDIAPVIESISIDLVHILTCYDRVAAAANAVVVEGVGGFRMTFDLFEILELTQQLGLLVILVAEMRLRCHHALPMEEAVAVRGLTLAGWAAMVPSRRCGTRQPANIKVVAVRLQAPLLSCARPSPILIFHVCLTGCANDQFHSDP